MLTVKKLTQWGTSRKKSLFQWSVILQRSDKLCCEKNDFFWNMTHFVSRNRKICIRIVRLTAWHIRNMPRMLTLFSRHHMSHAKTLKCYLFLFLVCTYPTYLRQKKSWSVTFLRNHSKVTHASINWRIYFILIALYCPITCHCFCRVWHFY